MPRDAGAEVLRPDLCVIGAGSGGLSVAAGAVQMGASVVLVEGGEMGGDCLNHGCVPSKALIAAAKHARAFRTGAAFGVAAAEPEIDFSRVMAHVRDVIAGIAPHDSQERFEGLGVRVLREWARFTGPREAVAGAVLIRPRRFVIATGARPSPPPIPGLDATPYLTNETLFDLETLPERLLVLGGGPIGIEMAQAFRRLGAEVVVLEAGRALGREDPEAAAVVLDALRAEGVEIREGAQVAAAAPAGAGATLTLADGETVRGSHLLVATGRKPALDPLDLDRAGVAADAAGVRVDAGLRSISNRRVYAVGDAAGGPQFTHLAGYHAGVVIRSALFRLPASARTDHIPRVTYADPELAQIGPTEAEARAADPSVSVLRAPYADNDRARTERRADGLVKAILDRRGRVIGATLVGADAGEQVGLWALAVSQRMKIGALAGMVAPYPTRAEASKRAASAHFAPRLFESGTVKRVVRLLARFG
jgi:pyruvate/2-oxoglutarate dehydrogenase complex dihydrolipoamide dehydrogenase (E3) component